MYLEILTPDKTVFSGKISSITVPGTKGPFTVLNNHAPVISTLERGELSLTTTAGKDLYYVISQGMIEVKQNKIMVLVESISTIEQ